MSQNVELEQLPPGSPEQGAPASGLVIGDLRRLASVPVEVTVEIGRARMTVGEALELREGSVITLDRVAGESVDLLVNGTRIGRGEVVVIDEQFGLRMTEVLAASPGATPDATAGGPVAPSADSAGVGA